MNRLRMFVAYFYKKNGLKVLSSIFFIICIIIYPYHIYPLFSIIHLFLELKKKNEIVLSISEILQ